MNHGLGIRGLLADYASGERVPAAVIRAAHRRAEDYPQPVWITLLDWDVVAGYLERLGAPGARHPLYGIPFAIKDNIDLAGALTTAACPAFGYLPRRSAFVVERLIEAGAIPLGKTNMDQFATGLVGTRTPYGACRSVSDGRYVSGGSSSGSAVAVAAGLVSFALGTDTAGSGRVPAAFNAIVGLKPSLGLLSTAGVLPACRTLDCVSIFAGNAADAGLVFAAAVAEDPEDPYSRSPAPAGGGGGVPAGPRVGVPQAGQLDFLGDARAAVSWAGAVERAGELGFELVDIDLEPYLAAARLLYQGAWVAERTAAVGEFVLAHPEAVDPVVGDIIAGGARPSAVDAFRGAYRLAELRRATAPDWERIDVLLLPTTPTIYTPEEIAADPVGRNAALGTYTNFVNLMDLCAVAVPGVPGDGGPPFGVSLIAPRDADELVLRLAAAWLGEEPPPAGPAPDATALLVVAGAHLSGQPLNCQLTDRGARLEALSATAPVYRLFELADAQPPKPGLVRAEPGQGRGIEVEVWRLAPAGLAELAAGVAPPLSIGAVELADGSSVPGFVCDSGVAETSVEITAWGGWRAFLAGQAAALPGAATGGS
ncbi:MAG: allophanate hydrolase [Solirubrobacteraceae bacterium]|nr:allophanate hydrolase [Solirubrobacteraceae bacterium]